MTTIGLLGEAFNGYICIFVEPLLEQCDGSSLNNRLWQSVPVMHNTLTIRPISSCRVLTPGLGASCRVSCTITSRLQLKELRTLYILEKPADNILNVSMKSPLILLSMFKTVLKSVNSFSFHYVIW